MDLDTIMSLLTVEEKAALVSGTDFMYTNAIPRLHIPSLCMADGPHGLRKQTGKQDNGIAQSEPATAFPTAACTASGWNPDNLYKMGSAIAEECKHYRVHVLLGPAVNIKRNPLCGRNFEYFSEDPLLAGKLASAEVNGVQSQGVGVSVKHFALNNSENYRFMGNSIADMRAIREIYLKVYEYVVKESHPATMMCAYNTINGTYCSENRWLLTDVLRDEWGFDGAVMTDWGATHDRVEGIKAGLDLEMPGDTAICRKWIIDGVRKGILPEEDLDKAVINILKLIEKYVKDEDSVAIDFKAHNQLAAEIAEDCAVLLKNDGCLPLSKDDDICIIGDLFEKMRYQGSGSSMICPTSVTSTKDAFDANKIKYTYCRGYKENTISVDEELIKEAVTMSSVHSKVVVFAGLTDYVESEGCDRENMRLPENQLLLIDALLKLGKPIIVVLFGGGVIELPFADQANAILDMFLPGQNGGTAVVDLLYGNVSPSGRLSETWPYTYDDVPFGKEYGQGINEVYKESIYVGYRYYQRSNVNVRYPFGYGLSYSSFSYNNMVLNTNDDIIEISVDVTNTGNYYAGEVVELYVKAPDSDVIKPYKELRGFQKVYLNPGETKTVNLSVEVKDLAYYHHKENRWFIENGTYEFQICSDCQTVVLSKSIAITGYETIHSPYDEIDFKNYADADLHKMNDEAFERMSGVAIPKLPSRYPVTLESRFTDLQQTMMGIILFNAVLSVAKKQQKDALKLPEGIERDNKLKGALFLKRILESNSVISMSMSSGKSLPYNLACGFVELTNGHFIKGLKCIMTPIKVPALPKNKKGE